MSIHSDYKVGALTEEEYRFLAQRENNKECDFILAEVEDEEEDTT